MNNICIVTDSSVQFPKPNFPGRELVTVMPFEIYYDGRILSDLDALRPNHLPKIASHKLQPHLIPPDSEKIRRVFLQLAQQYEIIFGVFLSREITSLFLNAQEAEHSLKGKVNIHLIDSRTTSVGLGLLIMQLIESIHAQDNMEQIERRLRSAVTRLYTLFCTPSLSYLHYNGFIEKTQTLISEMLGIVTIFAVEEGCLSPIEKVKTPRHALAFYQEFVEEFEDVEHIAYIQSAKPNFKDARDFYESVLTSFPGCSFSKHPINLPLSILFGPSSTCLVVLERA